MKNYLYGIKISEIKQIYGGGGSSDISYFHIEYKGGSKERFSIYTNDNTSFELERKIRRELLEAFNEYNNVEESYLLENEAHVRINGEWIHFGTRCINNLQEYVYLTLKEVDELRRQFKIKDGGWRHLAACTLFKIEKNRVDRRIPKRYVEQLEYMGYDVSKLEYELKD